MSTLKTLIRVRSRGSIPFGSLLRPITHQELRFSTTANKTKMAGFSLGRLKTVPSKLLFRRKELEQLKFYSVLCANKSKEIQKTLKILKRSRSSSQDENVVSSKFKQITIPNKAFHEVIFENFGKWEHKVAVDLFGTGKKLKFSELRRESMALAAALQNKFKLTKGDVQGIILPNVPEYPIIFLAGSMTGVVSSTINPLYTSTELSRLFQIIEPKILYTLPDLYATCSEALKLSNFNIPIVVIKLRPDDQLPEGAVALTELTSFQGKVSHVDIDMNDNLVLPFSSGTSGLPKAVQLSHKNIISNLFQYASGTRLKDNPHSDQCSVLGVLPWFHIYGMVIVVFDGLREGARIVSIPKFDPQVFVKAIYQEKIEVLYVVPPIIIFLGNSPQVDEKSLQYVQHVVNGAAPVGETDVDRVLKKSKNLDFCQGYGMTETSPVVTLSHPERFHKVSSTGHPVTQTFVKVTDIETGKALPAMQKGEIRVKGPQVMKGYYKLPQENKNTFDEDGWLKTGDIGHYDEEHDFYISDRIKELIKVKGFQVAPAEIEEILRNHPKIIEAGVIGVEHPKHGEAPKAFVVLKAGESMTEEEVQEYIKSKLSEHKQLRGGVKFVPEIPKSAAGKILRRHLKDIK